MRPMPVWTSSRIKSTPRWSHNRRKPARYPAEGMLIPPSPWIGLDQNRGCLIVEHRGDRREVVVGNIDEAGHHRLEPDVVLGLGRGRQCGVGPAVEASLHRDDLEAPLLVTEGPGQLDGGLIGLGPAVAEEALAAE